MSGIYLHIPFCNQFCSYCSFYSVKGKNQRERFVKAIYNEIVLKKEFFRERNIIPNTIYFGGGTPSVLETDVLAEMLNKIIKEFDFSPTEVTIEVNPNDISNDYAKGLFSAGFNRVSMGVQSFVDGHLKLMNRRHTAKEAEQAYFLLRGAGFKNISLDLIFGFRALSEELWQYNLKKIVELSPEHISSYQLSIDGGTPLYSSYLKGEYIPLPDDLCSNQYSVLQDFLQKNGYGQYEISSFAKIPISENKSKHNSSYWDKVPYLGLGPAAHSYSGDVRSWNCASLAKYCRCFLDKTISWRDIETREILSGRDKYNETIMLGLRKVEGMEISKLDTDFYDKRLFDKMLASGELEMSGGKIRIPSDKLFVSDGIIGKLFIL